MVGKYMIPSEPFKEAYFLEDALKFRKSLTFTSYLRRRIGLQRQDRGGTERRVRVCGHGTCSGERAGLRQPYERRRARSLRFVGIATIVSPVCIVRIWSSHKNVKGLPECIVREIKRLEYK